MNKTLLATSVSLALGASSAQAAFTSLTDGNYQLVITSGCHTNGDCQTTGAGSLIDNFTDAQASINITTSTSNLPAGTYGSGIVSDGLMGLIDFTLSGGIITVNSFSQDSYLNTAAGTVFIDAPDVSGMGGTIDAFGNMSFDPTGRRALAAGFMTSLGANPWNIDDSSIDSDGLYETWTTGTSTNHAKGVSPAFTLTGSALQDAATGEWTGTLVSAGNWGSSWGGFSGTQMSDVYNITITASAVPVPAAIWLFGSGIIGLFGLARRKQSVYSLFKE